MVTNSSDNTRNNVSNNWMYYNIQYKATQQKLHKSNARLLWEGLGGLVTLALVGGGLVVLVQTVVANIH